LLVHSPIPVLVIGSHADSPTSIRKILFPTDFGDQSREMFRRTCTVAKQMNAEVRLLHSVPMPARAVVDIGYYPSIYGLEGEMIAFEDFMRIQSEHQVRRAQLWTEWAKAEGIDCDYVIDTSGETAGDVICREATYCGADLIMMEGHSGPLKVALMGSTSRDVVRHATCPVLVIPRQRLVRAAEVAPEYRSEAKTMNLSFARNQFAQNSELAT
ncbi:MAG: universal stress protein, partial [Proteobacteria bacterium]